MRYITITKVTINKFKSITNGKLYLPKGGVSIEGGNAIGKSNFVNAIYWCLTGVDLTDSSDTATFIPKQLRKEIGEVIDVEVELDLDDGKTLKIRRVVTQSAKGLSTVIFLNDVLVPTLKEAEIDIDNQLGILEYTLHNYSNKDFNLRRFVLNPMYLYTLAPKTIRDVVVKQYLHLVPTDEIAKVMEGKLVKGIVDYYNLSDNLNDYQKLCTISDSLSNEIKVVKAKVELFKGSQDTINLLMEEGSLTGEEGIKIKVKLSDVQVKYGNLFTKKETEKKIIDDAKLKVESLIDKELNKHEQFIKTKLLTTNDKGILKATYEMSNDEVVLKQRSTSESIFDARFMIQDHLHQIGCDICFPLFIDKTESIEFFKLEKTAKFNQLITSRVNPNGKSKEMKMVFFSKNKEDK